MSVTDTAPTKKTRKIKVAAVSNDNATAEVSEPKVRKVRTPKEKAPSRKENPAGYQAHYLKSAIENLKKRDEQIHGWGLPAIGDPSRTVGEHFGDALYSLSQVSLALAAVPADFKAPRKRGAGGGRPAKSFAAGQSVKLSNAAIARVREFFPDVNLDCQFVIAPTAKATGTDGKPERMFPIMCTGIGGALPAFYVGREHAKELTAA
jgi:hypothetical protein